MFNVLFMISLGLTLGLTFVLLPGAVEHVLAPDVAPDAALEGLLVDAVTGDTTFTGALTIASSASILITLKSDGKTLCIKPTVRELRCHTLDEWIEGDRLNDGR